MSMTAHIETLEKKHAELEEAINQESHRPAPDFTRVTQWKRQKLRLKEELERLKSQPQAA